MKDNMRRLIIDRMLSEKAVVTFSELQTALQVSAPTLKRDLRYMRETLNAPIIYSRSRGGYVYDQRAASENDGDEKRLFSVQHKEWYSAQELYVLVKTISLLGELAKDESSAIRSDLEPLRARVTGLLDLGSASPRELLARTKVIDHTPLHGEPQSFQMIGAALCERRRLQIAYCAPGSKNSSFREVSPIRLVHYKSRWYLDAFCHVSDKLRTFAIENIRRAELLNRPAYRIALHEAESELDKSYGLYRSGELKTAVLLFDEVAAPFVRRQVWHPKQKMIVQANGSVRFKVPYTNSTELIGEILRWRSHAVVEEPEELRQEVRNSLEQTLRQYDR